MKITLYSTSVNNTKLFFSIGKNLKKAALFFLYTTCILLAAETKAQDDGSQYVQHHNYSPDGGNFNFSSNSVDFYAGKVSTTLPIHTYKGRELNLPISLGYNSDGVQVEELATITGLGWSLGFGGRITTIVNSEPDFIYSQARDYVRDVYMLQLPGITEYFKMEYYQPMAQINPGIGAELRPSETSNWVIYMPDGSKYFFENAEEKNTIYSGSGSQAVAKHTFVSSWLLTKIISKNGLDVYKFEYKKNIWTNPIPNNGEGYVDTTYGTHIYGASYSCTQQNPTVIYHNDEKIISFTYGSRSDMVFSTSTGNALQSINFHNYKGSPDDTTTTADDPTVYKKAVFTYSYFGQPNSPNFLDKRLKLDELTFYGINTALPAGEAGDKYKFDYDNPDKVPPITSFAQDYLGLFNNKTANTNLVDALGSFNEPSRRSYSFIHSQYGILKRITYPTKGFTDYEFEQNRLDDNYQYYYQGDSYRTDQVDVAFVGYNNTLNPSVSNTGMHCGSNSSPGAHPSMAGNVNFYNYGGDYETRSYLGVYTTLLTVTAADTFFISTPGAGKGVYLIQTLSGVTCNPLNTYCCPIQNFPSGTANSCLRLTNTISYTGSDHYPEGYVKGGATRIEYPGVVHDSIILQPGNYQVTVWSYKNTLTSPPLARMRIYKKVQTFVPPHLVNVNIPGTLTDGFRIKSITNYSGPSIFVGKKEFKYNKGQLFHHYNLNYSPGVRISSQGYLYEDVVFYQSVTEREVNQAGESNGSTEYIYGNTDQTAGEPGGYLTVAHKGLERYYDPVYGGSAELMIDKIHNSDLKEKRIYGKDGLLRYSEKNHYGFVDYAQTYFYWAPDPRGDEPAEQSEFRARPALFPVILSKTITNYPELDKGISTTTEYSYDQNNILTSKTILRDTDTEYEYFGYNWMPHSAGYAYGSFYPAGSEIQDANQIQKSSTVYENALSATTPGLFKTILSSTEGRTDLEYDSDKNLVTKIKYTPGTLTPASYESYIYGYSNRFPVAKIVGRKYSELSNTLVTNIKNATNVPVSATSENTLRNRINVLRSNYPDCLITGYTYNPAYGITCVINPNGYTQFYEYDIFGRLKFTKEGTTPANSQILSEKQFNNRPQ